MATFKKTKLWVACMHALCYTLPFLMITQHPTALLVICSTHAVIDRYSLAGYWCRFWGIGCPGYVYLKLKGLPLSENEKNKAPDWLYVWLQIIVDNTMHLGINYGCLTLCPYLHWAVT
jgi:hypothetical protein